MEGACMDDTKKMQQVYEQAAWQHLSSIDEECRFCLAEVVSALENPSYSNTTELVVEYEPIYGLGIMTAVVESLNEQLIRNEIALRLENPRDFRALIRVIRKR
jgi:hypothetical protein